MLYLGCIHVTAEVYLGRPRQRMAKRGQKEGKKMAKRGQEEGKKRAIALFQRGQISAAESGQIASV